MFFETGEDISVRSNVSWKRWQRSMYCHVGCWTRATSEMNSSAYIEVTPPIWMVKVHLETTSLLPTLRCSTVLLTSAQLLDIKNWTNTVFLTLLLLFYFSFLYLWTKKNWINSHVWLINHCAAIYLGSPGSCVRERLPLLSLLVITKKEKKKNWTNY